MAKIKAVPSNFGALIDKIAKESEEKLLDATEDFVIETFKEIIEETPVGKPELWKVPPPPGYTPGKAKSNWFPSIDSPSGERTESKSGSEQRLNSLRGRVAGRKAYLTNNQPYVAAMEYVPKFNYTHGNRGWARRVARSSEARINRIVKKYSGD